MISTVTLRSLPHFSLGLGSTVGERFTEEGTNCGSLRRGRWVFWLEYYPLCWSGVGATSEGYSS
jgi:hypothetical protein